MAKTAPAAVSTAPRITMTVSHHGHVLAVAVGGSSAVTGEADSDGSFMTYAPCLARLARLAPGLTGQCYRRCPRRHRGRWNRTTGDKRAGDCITCEDGVARHRV